jgi:AraC-like DNA-binding protein
MDVLSDMLEMVRLESTVFAQTWLSPPWGIRADGREHFAFHVLPHGGGRLEVEGLDAVDVGAGDVVVLAPGRSHALYDQIGSPVRDLRELLAEGAFDPRQAEGASGTNAYLICGCFRFADVGGERLVGALPTLIHIRGDDTTAGPWLAQTIRLLADEAAAQRPGAATVVKRLCDALFIYVLRSHLAGLPAEETSWLRALVDPQISEALRLIHGEPAAPWTVAKLAAAAGMSRSAFAARFGDLVGEPPMSYIAQWRLRRAAVALRTTRREVTEIAASAGYESTAAFSKAFRRLIGEPPAAYRRSSANSPYSQAVTPVSSN